VQAWPGRKVVDGTSHKMLVRPIVKHVIDDTSVDTPVSDTQVPVIFADTELVVYSPSQVGISTLVPILTTSPASISLYSV